MTLCIEAYIGAEGGAEGVKLEEQIVSHRPGQNVCPAIRLKRRCCLVIRQPDILPAGLSDIADMGHVGPCWA